MKKLMFIIVLAFISWGVSAQSYIGAAKCKMCHNSVTKGAQYTKWKETKHANAWSVLSETEKNNSECVSCHSTAANIQSDGVSCESCHGAGSVYKSMTIMKDREKSLANGLTLPSKEVCEKCHNDKSPHFKGFDYEKAKILITH